MASMVVHCSSLAAACAVSAAQSTSSSGNYFSQVAPLRHAKLAGGRSSRLAKVLLSSSSSAAQPDRASFSSSRKAADSRAETDDNNLDFNMEELDEEQLDELFETYGEVVKADSGPTSSEVDDDAESLAFAVALAEVANEVKAGEIRVLCVKPLVYWTRFFVIATGFSRPQVDAIGRRMRDMAEERYKRTPRGDLKPNAWTLLDFGDVVVHIFYPKERTFYNLEEFYGNATSVELPFKPQSQLH